MLIDKRKVQPFMSRFNAFKVIKAQPCTIEVWVFLQVFYMVEVFLYKGHIITADTKAVFLGIAG